MTEGKSMIVDLMGRINSLEILGKSQAARIAQLEGALLAAKRTHVDCEDCWYSCPKSEDGCCDARQGIECNCGADTHNALIDAALEH